MPENKKEPVLIKSNTSSNNNDGELYTCSFNSRERMVRAGKMLALCWGIALITVFIPIAHFFLVPLFLIAGPVSAYMKYNVTMVMEKASGTCPECLKTVDIVLDPADKLPKHTYCPNCNKPLQLLYHDSPTS